MLGFFLVSLLSLLINPFVVLPSIALAFICRSWMLLTFATVAYTGLFVLLYFPAPPAPIFWLACLVSVALWAILTFTGKRLVQSAGGGDQS